MLGEVNCFSGLETRPQELRRPREEIQNMFWRFLFFLFSYRGCMSSGELAKVVSELPLLAVHSVKAGLSSKK